MITDLVNEVCNTITYWEIKMTEYIPKDKLIKGKRYKCDARNFGIGTWNGKEFDYMRYKFGDRFPDTEYHYDDGHPYGTVKPLELIEGTCGDCKYFTGEECDGYSHEGY